LKPHGRVLRLFPEDTACEPRLIFTELIKALDERGHLAQLERPGLADYLVYPAINWGQKSQNIKAIAERINIGVDTRDSAPQRNEVQTSLP